MPGIRGRDRIAAHETLFRRQSQTTVSRRRDSSRQRTNALEIELPVPVSRESDFKADFCIDVTTDAAVFGQAAGGRNQNRRSDGGVLDAEVHEIRTVRGCCRLRGGGRKQAQGCEADNPEDERLQKSSWLHLILLSKSTRHRIKTRGFPPLAHVGFGVIKFWEPEPTWERALPRSGLQLRIETTVYALPRRGRILLPVPCGCQVKFFLDSDGTRKEGLPPGHLLSHVQQQLSVAFVHATQQPAELDQKTGVFAGAAPVSPVRSLAFREIGQLRRFLAVVEERSEEHTSELQSRLHLVCSLLLEKKNNRRRFPASDNRLRQGNLQ